MIEQAFIELIHKEIDSQISPSERQKLRDYLQINTEARAYHDKLVQVAAVLGKITSVEPPAGLKQTVMSEVYAHHRHVTTHSDSPLSTIRTFFRSLSASPIFLVSTGAVVGAVLLMAVDGKLLSFDGQSGRDLSGSLVPYPSHSTQELGSWHLTVGASSVTVRATRNTNQVTISLSSTSSQSLKAELGFAESDLTTESITRDGKKIDSLNKSIGSIELRPIAGSEYKLIFNDRSEAVSSLHITLTDGGLSAEQLIPTGYTSSAK